MKAAKMLSPTNLAELTAALPRMTEKSKVVAGGTDLVVAIKAGRARPDLLLSVRTASLSGSSSATSIANSLSMPLSR